MTGSPTTPDPVRGPGPQVTGVRRSRTVGIEEEESRQLATLLIMVEQAQKFETVSRLRRDLLTALMELG